MAELNPIKKIKSVLLHPDKFFDLAKKEKGMADAVKYYVFLSLVPTAISTLLGFAMGSLYEAVLGGGIANGTVGLFIYGFVWVAGILWRFIAAGILHAFALLLGAKKGYAETYKAVVYSNTPHQLTALMFPVLWIPSIGPIIWFLAWGIAGIYGLYLGIKGISVLQDLSMGRAAGVVALAAWNLTCPIRCIIPMTIRCCLQKRFLKK